MQHEQVAKKKEENKAVVIIHFRKKFSNQQHKNKIQQLFFSLKTNSNGTFTKSKEVENLRLINVVSFFWYKHVIKW